MVHGRADARWLPSRHNFAIFRLGAYLRLRAAKPDPIEGMLYVDRNQSTFETWVVGLWIIFTVSCFVAAGWLASWPLLVALIVAFPIATILVQAVVVGTGIVTSLLLKTENHLTVNSFALMVMFAGAAAYATTRPSWIRFVGWHVLALFVVNAIAAAILFLLRDSIARLEASVGGASSGS